MLLDVIVFSFLIASVSHMASRMRGTGLAVNSG